MRENVGHLFDIKNFNFKDKINIFYLLLAFLPFIDLLTALETRFLDFSLTLGILVKGLLLIGIVYYLLFKCKISKKKMICKYLIVLFIFSILYLFTKMDISNFSNLISEVINIFKFSFYPIFVIGLLAMDEEKIIDRKIIANIFSFTFIIYILFIFVPYITGTGFKSYGLLELSNGTVGWFYSANELGSILILLFTFVYLLLERKKYFLFILFAILGSYSAFIIGTKVASFGILIVAFIMIVYYLLYKGDDKWKKFILTLIVFIVGIYSFKIGPTEDNVNDNYSRYENTEQEEDIHIDIKNKFQSFAISLLSGREVFAIRVARSYNNASIKDKIFGIGFTYRESLDSKYAARLIEMDFLDMFFRFGILGFLIFILPILYVFVDIIRKIFSKKAKITIDFIRYALIWAMVVSIAFIAGHVLGSPAVSLYLGFATLFMYKSLKEV
jgi:hypothetical protein